MRSSVFRLRRISRFFCTQTAISSAPLTATAKARLNSLFKEKDLTKLVQDFKRLSETPRLRHHHNIYEKTVARLALAKEFPLIEDLLEHHKKYDDIKREGFAIRLISLYGKAGMPDHAYKLFDEMPQRECERTVKSLNAVLHAYVQSSKFDEAEKLFRELPSKTSIKPNDRSYTEVIRALCEKGDLESAEKMLDEMESNGVKPNVYTFNILVNGLYSNGRFEDGDRVWDRMDKSGVEPDLVSFNGKFKGLMHGGKMSDAIKVLEELKSRELKPNIITYNILVRCCCNAGNLNEAKGVYDRLRKSDCIPNRATYQALIPCSCEKGDLDFALELCKESVNAKCYIDVAILENVVNLLVKDSRVEEAEELLELTYSGKYNRLKLKMPATKERRRSFFIFGLSFMDRRCSLFHDDWIPLIGLFGCLIAILGSRLAGLGSLEISWEGLVRWETRFLYLKHPDSSSWRD